MSIPPVVRARADGLSSLSYVIFTTNYSSLYTHNIRLSASRFFFLDTQISHHKQIFGTYSPYGLLCIVMNVNTLH